MNPPENFGVAVALAEADSLVRGGDQPAAIVRLEQAVQDDIADLDGAQARVLYIRLASLYRTHERYQDELALLEGYVSRHPDDSQRTRFQARLSKLRALIGQSRTSSVVPVMHGGIVRPRQSRVTKRLLDHDRRTELSRQQGPNEAGARLRQRAEELIARATVAFAEASIATRQQAQLLQSMEGHRTAFRQLMTEYGATLARNAVPRMEVRELVRAMAIPATASGRGTVPVLASDAERWCLRGYDAAA
jgi:hypothetical protein